MKKNKGFTLIELLAIIVILAIIAVITVPIILNIIDNSKRGAVKDSAYGYKDAVNKYYVSKLAQDKNYTIPNATYSVTATGTLSDGTNTLEVASSGKTPGNNSWVTIENNKVVSGCLQFDEYKIEITNGQLGEATVGTCASSSSASANATCPSADCVYAYNTTAVSIGGTLTGYSSDYTTLSNSGNTPRIFLGYILGDADAIEKAYICAIDKVDDNVVCAQGGVDESSAATPTIFNANKSAFDDANFEYTELSSTQAYYSQVISDPLDFPEQLEEIFIFQNGKMEFANDAHDSCNINYSSTGISCKYKP